jgi:hypothetical protein
MPGMRVFAAIGRVQTVWLPTLSLQEYFVSFKIKRRKGNLTCLKKTNYVWRIYQKVL